MKTTNEGFLVNTLRRIPRHGVKALAAGALLIAAALPLAVASSAGAATAPTLTSVQAFDTVNGGGTQTAGVSFGAGASGTLTFTGNGFAHDGGVVTLTTNATGVTFSGASEGTSATNGTANFSSTTSVAPGTYSVTLTDDNGTSNTVANAFTVVSDPTIAATTPLTVATLSDGNGATAVTVSGTGFEVSPYDAGATGTTAPKVTLTSTVNGTTLTGAANTAVSGGSTATALNFTVTPTNSVNGYPATPGTYTLTVANGDGGSVTSGPIFTITAYGITNVSPSALPVNTPASVTDSYVTVGGSGFEYGAGVTIAPVAGSGPAAATPTGLSVVSATVTSATTVSVELAQTASETNNGSMGLWSVTVANPSTGLGGNGATYSLLSAIGVGEASTVAPTVTAATTAAALVAGGVPSTMTITGTGFSQYSTVTLYPGTSATPSTTVTAPYVAGNTGTTLSASVTAAAGATAGPYSITVSGSSPFAAAATVAGPVITSQTPLTVNAPAGTVVTLTGTGFQNIDSGAFTPSGGGGALQGIVSYVNATTLNFVVTTPANAFDITASTNPNPNVVVTQTVGGVSTLSPAFKIVVTAGPVVNSAVTYATAPINDVGVGATAEVVTIHGTGFATGVTVTGFTNGGGVADPDVTATVTGVNTAGTAITATIAVATGDLNIADGYTVTNTNGGTFKVSAISYPVVIGPGPTITSVTPATSPASATTAFTIVGTNFESGVAVAATADGTCGTTTATNATTLTVSCTFGAATATAAALQVINPDGGTATSATIIPAATATTGAPHATSESGSGIIGRTVHISVQGVGFYGQPSVSSTGNSVKAVVSGDTGTVLTIQITVGKTTGPGEHTLTFTLADGKVFKANYSIIK